MEKNYWIFCPACHSKTRMKIRHDTELKRFPLYYPKCKQEHLINVKSMRVDIIKSQTH